MGHIWKIQHLSYPFVIWFLCQKKLMPTYLELIPNTTRVSHLWFSYYTLDFYRVIATIQTNPEYLLVLRSCLIIQEGSRGFLYQYLPVIF